MKTVREMNSDFTPRATQYLVRYKLRGEDLSLYMTSLYSARLFIKKYGGTITPI